MKYIIHSVRIINEGRSFEGSVLVDHGKIQGVYAAGLQAPLPEVANDAETLDATGCLLLPGVIDTHVHFRDPGFPHKGTWQSESRAAVAGGVTTVADMPNTLPQTTTIAALQEKKAAAAQNSLTNTYCYLGATADNVDLIAKLTKDDAFAVKLFMGSSTGNMLLSDDKLLSRLFAECPLPIVAHCESEAIIRQNTERYKSLYGEQIPFAMHPQIRSAEACYTSTEKAVALAQKYGALLHVAHLSTARELQLFSQSEAKITAETCPHYLWFCDEDYAEKGALIKCNPAIKSADDRAALRRAVASGAVASIGSDHAPHTPDEKRRSYLNAPSGLPLIQHSLVSMLELAQQGFFSAETVVEKMCHAPARIFGIPNRGFIRAGYAADLVLVRPCAPWQVTNENTLHKCGWSAFAGQTFSHKVIYTFVNGKIVWREGESIHSRKSGNGW
ncbi:MAG: dihydroorotase [Prevotellaceae bacterium]|nr:dihydroorotase [Prevotellaceae bacterium]